jgi:hypothetical protein
MSVLIATDLLLAYLLGQPAAARAMEEYSHRSISVLTWLEAMAAAPADRREATRAFLRSFERLSLNEAIADEALVLLQARPGMDLHQALNRATARMNKLEYIDAPA